MEENPSTGVILRAETVESDEVQGKTMLRIHGRRVKHYIESYRIDS